MTYWVPAAKAWIFTRVSVQIVVFDGYFSLGKGGTVLVYNCNAGMAKAGQLEKHSVVLASISQL